MARNKNCYWNTGDTNITTQQAQLAVLMDIRDELQSLVRLANCYRLPRALDAMYELGVEARRRKRSAAKKRRAAKTKR